jgi:hypothetical protein
MALFAAATASLASLSAIPTGEFNIPRSAIPSGWMISALSARLAAKEIPMITRQRRRSTLFTRKNSSITRAGGKTPGR